MGVSQFLKCFDLRENFGQLTEMSANKNEYQSVHGVRFFSALALIMAHKTMALLYNPYINKSWMAEVTQQTRVRGTSYVDPARDDRW